jgi:hypothetical protein
MLFFLYTPDQKIFTNTLPPGKVQYSLLASTCPSALFSSSPLGWHPPWGKGDPLFRPSPRLWTLLSRSHIAPTFLTVALSAPPLNHGHRDLSFVCLFVQTGCRFTPPLFAPRLLLDLSPQEDLDISGCATPSSPPAPHWWRPFSPGWHPTASSPISWHLTASSPISWHLTASTPFMASTLLLYFSPALRALGKRTATCWSLLVVGIAVSAAVGTFAASAVYGFLCSGFL